MNCFKSALPSLDIFSPAMASDLRSLLLVELQLGVSREEAASLHLVATGFEHVIVRPTAL
jgi:hypothetical protein